RLTVRGRGSAVASLKAGGANTRVRARTALAAAGGSETAKALVASAATAAASEAAAAEGGGSAPLFEVHVELSVPAVTVSPSVDAVQAAVNVVAREFQWSWDEAASAVEASADAARRELDAAASAEMQRRALLLLPLGADGGAHAGEAELRAPLTGSERARLVAAISDGNFHRRARALFERIAEDSTDASLTKRVSLQTMRTALEGHKGHGHGHSVKAASAAPSAVTFAAAAAADAAVAMAGGGAAAAAAARREALVLTVSHRH
ncbi:hypothetical protein T492DRAFT_869607, partial [Pavlovales sp. CCMP2436]